jgi:hypothetical protein
MDSSFEDQQNPSNIDTVWTKFNNALQSINQHLKTHPNETFQLGKHFNITEIEELINDSNDKTILDSLKTAEVKL